jgi:hypothetical protein
VQGALDRLRPTPAQCSAKRALAAAEAVLAVHVRPRALGRARTVLLALYEATYTLIQERSQSAQASSYTFFTVLDVLPVATALSTATCERATADLRTAGLITTWSSWTDTEFFHHGTGTAMLRRVKQGVWLTVNLNPCSGQPLVSRTHELPLESPRNLALDRRTGRTAWRAKQELRASEHQKNHVRCIYSILEWALPKKLNQETVNGSDALSCAELLARAATPQDLIWNLEAVFTVRAQDRARSIEVAGKALARLYRDEHSVQQYFGLLWRAVKAQEQGRRTFEQLQGVLVGVIADMGELEIRRPGAWLRARLMSFGWLDAPPSSA